MSHQLLSDILASLQANLHILRGIAERQESINRRLDSIERTLNTMTTKEEFDAALQKLLQAEAARDAAVLQSLTDLQAKIAAGQQVDLSAELASIITLQNNAAAITQAATADDPGPTDVTGPPSSTTPTTTKLQGPTTATAGQDQSLSVNVASTEGSPMPTGSVTLKDANGNVVNTAALDSNGNGTLVVAAIPAGSNSYTAEYGGDAANAASTSDPLAIVAS
jgi:hypothetical protein